MGNKHSTQRLRRLLTTAVLAVSVLSTPGVAFAHVEVLPAEVAAESEQVFTVSVPNEDEIGVTGVRLVIPAGLSGVSPTVKPGWAVDVRKAGDTVTEIVWTGGNIPAGQRDDFTFGAQIPVISTTLTWKAYQTYDDGTVVAWDQQPDESRSDQITPYSETRAVKDPAIDINAGGGEQPVAVVDETNTYTALGLGMLGVILGTIALLRKPKNKISQP